MQRWIRVVAPWRRRTRTGRSAPGVFEIDTESASRKRLARPAFAHGEGNARAVPTAWPTWGPGEKPVRPISLASGGGRVCVQASWFYGVCAVTVALLGAVLYLAIARRADGYVRRRLEARLEDRERASRELHDTLTQGLQGLILRFQAVCERIPAREPARELMEKALERADRMLVDTRDHPPRDVVEEQQVR